MNAAAVAPRELTVEALCELNGDGLRFTQRRVAEWFSQQHADPTVPRVRRERPLGAMRWHYVIDAASYEAWAQLDAPRPTRFALPRPGGDAARARGCNCVPMETNVASGAFVIASCPVHGRMFGDE